MQVTFRLVRPPQTKQYRQAVNEASRKIIADETKRIRKERFAPLVRPWSAKNRTSFRVKHFKPRDAALSQIIGTDKEDDKPLFGFVHRFGVPPHDIRATKPHGLLVFQINGRTIFTRKTVRHPGYRPSGKYDAILREEPNRVRQQLENGIKQKLTVTRS